jgi:phosphohistidine phosphatase
MSNPPNNIFQQSAAIPFRLERGEPRVLLITNRSGKRWIVPKGIIEDGQTPTQTALEEAYEEAGIHGSIVGTSLGSYEYRKWGGTCVVLVFLMQVEDELETWPESSFRDRKWVSIEEAVTTIKDDGLRRLVRKAAGWMKA